MKYYSFLYNKEMKRNELLEKIRQEAKQDPTWEKNAARRIKYYKWMMFKNKIHYKWLRFKRLIGLRK